MNAEPLIVLADDLTGAAEIAAIGFSHGLVVLLAAGDMPRLDRAVDLIVVDTNTRLLAPAEAARRVESVLHGARGHAAGRVFKKTDSVLRGPVAAELGAAARALGVEGVLLVPANPALGRCIQNGRYTVGGVELHKTAFANDPHHPARTAEAVGLLGPSSLSGVRSLALGATEIAPGLNIGDAASEADLATWARLVTPRILPAGAAGFFRAWLAMVRPARRKPDGPAPVPAGPTLVVSGSTAPVARNRVTAAAADQLFVAPIPPDLVDPAGLSARRLATYSAAVASALAAHGQVITTAHELQSCRPADIESFSAQLVQSLHGYRAFVHLVVEGGATAAALTTALGWTELDVVHPWGPGVVTLRPRQDPTMLLTLKPGSYPWPGTLLRHLRDARLATLRRPSPACNL